jgi:NAD(P)-dependent dehydrogenase (short-subunit alcohol dehydrogenase family)
MGLEDEKLIGKVAIVTGGSSGIGRQVCLALAREGARVVVVGRDRDRVAATVTEIKAIASESSCIAQALGAELDVCLEQDMEAMAKETLNRFGRIDVLVACAGILRAESKRPTSIRETSAQEWDRVLDTNLRGVFLCNRAVLRTMMKQRSGQIINVASLSGRQALALDAPYCASKFGVIGLTEALAGEMRSYGVRVQAILPGDTDTPIWSQNKSFPQSVYVMPVEHVADMVRYLLIWPMDSTFGEVAIAPLRTLRPPLWRTRFSFLYL